MTNAHTTPSLDASERAETLALTRGPVGSTVAEDQSFINIREVEDWCKESRDYRPPLLSSITLFSVSLGLLVGFIPAFAATDIDENGAWWGAFLVGSIIGGIGCAAALVAMVVPAIGNKMGHRKRLSPLERLAERMQRACEKGRLRAAAAESALRELEEKEREEGVGP